MQSHNDKQALLKVCSSVSNTMITHANPTAATKSWSNFSRGEGRAVWRTGATGGATKQTGLKLSHNPALCTAFSSNAQKVTKNFPEDTTGLALRCTSLRFHDFMVAGFGVEFQGDGHVWNSPQVWKRKRGHAACEVGFSGDDMKRSDLCFSVWRC